MNRVHPTDLLALMAATLYPHTPEGYEPSTRINLATGRATELMNAVNTLRLIAVDASGTVEMREARIQELRSDLATAKRAVDDARVAGYQNGIRDGSGGRIADLEHQLRLAHSELEILKQALA